MLEIENVHRSASSTTSQRFVSHDTNGRIIRGLHSVVAKTSVANQFETFGGHHIATLFAIVPCLQNWTEKIARPISKFVQRQVGNLKIDKAASGHQPLQIGGGDGFLRVKGARIEGTSGLIAEPPIDPAHIPAVVSVRWRRFFPSVIARNLLLGKGRYLARLGSIVLHAKAK